MKTFIYITFFLFSSTIFAQEKKRDTLFIKYDNYLLNREQVMGEKTFLYRIKGAGNDGFVYLLEQKRYDNLSPKKVLCFKNILKKSNAYCKKGKISDWKLAAYLGRNIVFLVKENSFIKVQVVHEIE